MKKSIWLSLMDTQGMCHTMLFTTHVGTKTICKKVNLLSDSDTHKDQRNGGLGDKPTVFENHRKNLIQHCERRYQTALPDKSLGKNWWN